MNGEAFVISAANLVSGGQHHGITAAVATLLLIEDGKLDVPIGCRPLARLALEEHRGQLGLTEMPDDAATLLAEYIAA